MTKLIEFTYCSVHRLCENLRWQQKTLPCFIYGRDIPKTLLHAVQAAMKGKKIWNELVDHKFSVVLDITYSVTRIFKFTHSETYSRQQWAPPYYQEKALPPWRVKLCTSFQIFPMIYLYFILLIRTLFKRIPTSYVNNNFHRISTLFNENICCIKMCVLKFPSLTHSFSAP